MAENAPLLRLVAATRRLVDRVVHVDAPAEVLEHAAAALDPHGGKRAFPLHGMSLSSEELSGLLPFSPVSGRYDPIAPPLETWIRDGVVHARGTFGSAYEGPPGGVHGSIVAAAFDQVLALVNATAGHFAMTGTLTVRFRKPTPLHAGDALLAEAEAIFIRVALGGQANPASGAGSGTAG
jgi:hypothetical protein